MKEKLDIHNNIKQKLDYLLEIKKIPHIIFHGPSGSGKRTLVYQFLDKIYNNNFLKQNYILFINCAQGKGIKFIRDDLKFFAKTHINYKSGNIFKTIILSNADKLTIDAQSALRRCIELFSHTTRFFIIVDDKYKLLKPILSRFAEIYVPYSYINRSLINLYKYNINDTDNTTSNIPYIHRVVTLLKNTDVSELYSISNKLYNKGITGLDLIEYITEVLKNNREKYELLIVIQKIKKEIRSEKILILFILNLILFRSDPNLEYLLDM